MPDRFVPIDTTAYSDYYRDLVAKGIINRYSITYVDNHRKELKADYPTEKRFLDSFEVTPAMLDEIVRLGEADSVKYNAEQMERSRTMMSTIIKGIVGRDLFDTSTYFKVVNPVLSPVYRQALDLINDDERYHRLLTRGREDHKPAK